MERMALKTIRAINLGDLRMNFNQLPRATLHNPCSTVSICRLPSPNRLSPSRYGYNSDTKSNSATRYLGLLVAKVLLVLQLQLLTVQGLLTDQSLLHQTSENTFSSLPSIKLLHATITSPLLGSPHVLDSS